jgi:hypothetical protein
MIFKRKYSVGESRHWHLVVGRDRRGKLVQPVYAVFVKVWWWPIKFTHFDMLRTFEEAYAIARKMNEGEGDE